MGEPSGGAKRKRAEGFFERVRLPVLFGLVTVLVLGVYYFFFVQRKYNYLTGRNFRFLATIGAQMESSLASHARRISSLTRQENLRERLADPDQKAQLLVDFAPGFEDVKLSPPPWRGAGLDQASIALATAPDDTWLEVFYPFEPKGSEFLRGRIRLRKVAEPLFRSRKAFDTVLLANTRGEVIYHQGIADLSVTRLSSLLDKSRLFFETGPQKDKKIADLLSGSSDSYLVELNGREYRLFVKPVSLPLRTLTGSGEAPEVSPESTWLICGLVPKKEFVYKSLAVSSALLALLLGLLLLALLSWPFLKLKLLGETQRVSVFDLILLGLCGLLGVSIATLFILDFKVFGDLKEDSRHQLEHLAGQIGQNIRTELLAAYPVLTRLERETLARRAAGDGTTTAANLPQDPGYPLAQTFMLIQRDGMQIYKGSFNKTVSPLISVQERSYFQKARARDLWDFREVEREPKSPWSRMAGEKKPFFLESTVGWTAGGRFAVLSKPVTAQGRGKADVSALAIPMISLIEPVLPPGFKFAVINNEDENARVLFHSDSERNSTEDFLSETDGDRRLRSAIFAHRAETMEIRYWGEDYIASVMPVQGLPWAVVALKDLKTLRAVNVDWLSTTLLFLLLYSGALAALLVTVAVTRPSYRAEWIWPDSKRLEDYAALGAAYLLTLAGFLLAVWALRASAELLAVSVLVPALALVLAYARLQKRDGNRKGFARGLTGFLVALLAYALLTAQVEAGRFILPSISLLLVLAASLLACGGLPFRRDWVASRIRPWWLGSSKEEDDSEPRDPARTPETEDDAVPDQRSINAAYCFCAAVLLFLTAVLPTAGFFEVSHRLHAESFLRHGQLRLAMDLKKRAIRAEQKAEKAAESTQGCLRRALLALGNDPSCGQLERGLDVYAGSFFGTTPDLPPLEPLEKNEAALCDCRDLGESDVLPGFLEDFLPRSSEHAAEMRELLHSASSDCAWHWTEGADGSPILHSRDYPDSEIHLSSKALEPSSSGPSPASLAGMLPTGGLFLSVLDNLSPMQVFLALLGFSVLLCLIRFVVRFISRKIFLIDLLEPLWAEREETGPSTTGRNLFLVSRGRQWKEEVKKDRFFWFNLKDLEDDQKGWPAIRSDLVSDERVILVEGFGDKIGDQKLNEKKLECLESLAAMKDRTVVVVSTVSPTRLLQDAPMPSATALRWKELLSSFTLYEEDLRIKPAESKKQVASTLGAVLESAQGQEEQTPGKNALPAIRSEVLKEECSDTDNPHLMAIARELDPQVRHLSREQILEELGERAEGYYQTLWASCSLQEEVVLEHLAAEGLVNEKSRRLIRRLMARGLVRRAPNFRLMNETFRRFVISSACRSEVLSVEKEADPSAWDRLRWPLFFGLAASITFFFVTQEALLDGIAASLTGLTAGLPAVVKAFDFFGGDRARFPRFWSSK